jgi:hypothetical protein
LEPTLTPAIYNHLILTNGVYSLFRADDGTQTTQPFAIEHFPTRELVDTFETETEAIDFYYECGQSEREGKPTLCPDARPVGFTLAGMLAIAGFPLPQLCGGQN